MTTYIGLLRAVNVGGTGKLPMAELRAMCAEAGFSSIRTYIASGNVILDSDAAPVEVKTALEARLAAYAGKPVGVLVRTSMELAAVLAANPFHNAAPNRTVAIFLDNAPPSNTLDMLSGRTGEEVALGAREIYVHYGEGMAQSRLKIPAAREGTARNMNTIARLVQMTGLQPPRTPCL